MKRRLSLTLLILAVVGGLAWAVLAPHGPPQPPEPVYEGRPLGYWLHGFDDRAVSAPNTNPPTFTEAVDAMNSVGTNAMPTLFRLLRARDPAWKLKFFGLAQRQHVVNVNFVPASALNREAYTGFACLGEQAFNAVPMLVAMLDADAPNFSQDLMPLVLASIDPQSAAVVAALSRACTNKNPVVRLNAAFTLGDIHADPGLAVPALTRCLHDSEPGVRFHAAKALAAYGAGARTAAPALVQTLKDPDAHVRSIAGATLKQIDPAAAAAGGCAVKRTSNFSCTWRRHG